MNEKEKKELVERLKEQYPDDYVGIVGPYNKVTEATWNLLVKHAMYKFNIT